MVRTLASVSVTFHRHFSTPPSWAWVTPTAPARQVGAKAQGEVGAHSHLHLNKEAKWPGSLYSLPGHTYTVHTCTHARTHAPTHARTYTCTRVRVCTCVFIFIHTAQTHIYIHRQTCSSTHAHMHIYTNKHTYTNTDAHARSLHAQPLNRVWLVECVMLSVHPLPPTQGRKSGPSSQAEDTGMKRALGGPSPSPGPVL